MNEPKTSIAGPDTTAIAQRFDLRCSIDKIERYGNGLINTTFLATARDTRYILQRINDAVFPDPERIMANLATLERHLGIRTDSGLRIPALIAARDGLPFVRAEDGGIWRLMEFMANTRGLARIDSLKRAREVGRILGRFHVLVSDLPPKRLAVTLPEFHVTPSYLERFTRVLARCTSAPNSEVTQAIAFVAARQRRAGVLEEARRQGRIPVRVVHGDPKLDNILFDGETGRAVSLIDLDTVQPGLIHYDIGDCIRSCCNRGGEYADVDARFDLDGCRAILGAYADETRGMLGTAEIELLFDSIRLIPLELGLRFLTDHLEGDRYFCVAERGQNLRKAQDQFALVEAIENRAEEIRQIATDCF